MEQQEHVTPTRETLEDLASGLLSATDSAMVRSHIRHCGHCQAVLKEIAPDYYTRYFSLPSSRLSVSTAS